MYADSRLISPVVELPTVSGDERVELRYWHWNSHSWSDGGHIEVSRWNGTAWERRRPLVSPSRRTGHAMAWDPVREVVMLVGGADDQGAALEEARAVAERFAQDGYRVLALADAGIEIVARI